MEPDSVLHQQLPSAYRSLQPQATQALQHGQPHLAHHTLASQAALDLSGLDEADAVFHQDLQRLQNAASHAQVFQSPNAFDPNPAHRHLHQQANGSPHTPQHHAAATQFGMLTPSHGQHSSIARVQQDDDLFDSPENGDQKGGGLLNLPIVVDPPDLEAWRQKLFNVDDMITLTEDEFQTYFPHVDNVYSHRSTQRYKRKPFISHYWDCRLKGRPPGTPKSDDPNKKKRKRTARERDLCDVKIKITEYFPAIIRTDLVPDPVPGPADSVPNFFTSPQATSGMNLQQATYGMLTTHTGLPSNHPALTGQRYFTIQRVNGNGGNGKSDGVAGPHKHTLEYSDKVKKNSIQRFLLKKDKEEKKTQKTYHKRATGAALVTVKKHAKDHELKLYGSCFCPFVQRVWIALEAKGLQYQYIETDPYKKSPQLLQANPRGLVPGLKHGDWGCGESSVLMEYLEDLGVGEPLLPVGNPQLRASCRLWSDHINRYIVSTFYQLLQAQEFQKQIEYTKKLQEQITKIVEAANPEGPFFLGPVMSYVDVQLAPWMLRCSRVLKHYRGWSDPDPGSRWARWVEAVEDNEHVKATTSTDDLYIDSYERYAQNRPNTSQLADAINGGYYLP